MEVIFKKVYVQIIIGKQQLFQYLFASIIWCAHSVAECFFYAHKVSYSNILQIIILAIYLRNYVLNTNSFVDESFFIFIYKYYLMSIFGCWNVYLLHAHKVKYSKILQINNLATYPCNCVLNINSCIDIIPIIRYRNSYINFCIVIVLLFFLHMWCEVSFSRPPYFRYCLDFPYQYAHIHIRIC